VKDIFSTINLRIFTYLSLYNNFTLSHIHSSLYLIYRTFRAHNFNRSQKRSDDSSLFEEDNMFVSSNAHRSVASTSAFKNLQKSEIMQNDLNQSKNFRRIETNSSFDELKKNSDASKMLRFNLNERLEQTKRLLRDREKLQKLKKMKTKIRALKRKASEIIEESTKKIESKEIEFFSNNLMQSIFISKKIVTSTVSNQKEDVSASRKRIIKFDKIFLYHDKSIKKHRDYVKNLTTTFRLIFDDFSTKNSKIVYVMQSLTKEFKKTWYRFEKQNLDHDYIFKKYCEHLLDLIENSINRHFHHAQFFSNAKQEKKQSMQVFDVFLNNLENQLTFYIEKQRIIHLFIKLRSKLRVALTNYQNLLIIKKELLILTNRLKNNMKKTIDVKTTFDNRSIDLKTSQHKNRKKEKKRNNKNSFNDKSKTKNRRENIDEKKRKRANHSHLICHKCNEIEYIATNCLDLKKKLKINAIFNKFKRFKFSKKEKSSMTTDHSSKTKNQ
jgi:hypothetical protein